LDHDVFHAGFYVGAVAALFMFSWKNLAIALFLWWADGRMGNRHVLSPAADAPWIQDAAIAGD